LRCGAVSVVQKSRARHQTEGSMDLARTGLPIRNSSDGQPVVAVRQAQQHNTRIKLFIHQISFLSFFLLFFQSCAQASFPWPCTVESPVEGRSPALHRTARRAAATTGKVTGPESSRCRGAGRRNISPDDRRSTCPRSPRPPSPSTSMKVKMKGGI
jgi:hypothetical protein